MDVYVKDGSCFYAIVARNFSCNLPTMFIMRDVISKVEVAKAKIVVEAFSLAKCACWH